MITFKKRTTVQSDIYSNGEKIGTVDRVGDYYLIEVMYCPTHLHIKNRKLIKGLVERIYKGYLSYEYKQRVKLDKLRNSKMYGSKYVEFFILD